MPYANDPLHIAEAIDPRDVVNVGIDLGNLLVAGEAIDPASIAVTVSADAAALGVGIASGGGLDAALAADGRTIVFWPQVDSARADDADFDRFGIEVEATVRIATTHVPPRAFERSVVLSVRRR